MMTRIRSFLPTTRGKTLTLPPQSASGTQLGLICQKILSYPQAAYLIQRCCRCRVRKLEGVSGHQPPPQREGLPLEAQQRGAHVAQQTHVMCHPPRCTTKMYDFGNPTFGNPTSTQVKSLLRCFALTVVLQ